MSITKPKHFWPSTQDIDVLSMEVLMDLYSNDKIDRGANDRYGQLCHSFIFDNAKYTIPRILTSRSAIYHLGFNPKTVGEIWNYVNDRKSATPMVIKPLPTPVTEFWKRLETWLYNRIRDITNDINFTPNASPKDLLNRLGLEDDAQNQRYRIEPLPGSFCLKDLRKSDVLPWAKRAITRKWTAIATLEFLLLRGEKEIQNVGLQHFLREITQRPLDTPWAYDFDPGFVEAYKASFKDYDWVIY